MPLETIYDMLSSLSVGNKKWLADHLYADIRESQDARTKEQLALDMEMSLLEAKAFMEGQKTLKTARFCNKMKRYIRLDITGGQINGHKGCKVRRLICR